MALPLVAIYFLKIKPIRRTTATFFLWDEILQEKKSSALFKRMRNFLSLLLMLLILLALVLTMADPVISTDQNKDYFIIIDNSASMNILEGNVSRIDLAKREAKKIITAMHVNKKVILATLSDEMRYIVSHTSNPKVLLEGLEKIEASIQDLNIHPLKKQLNNRKMMEQFRIILISDGNIEDVDDLDLLEKVVVGSKVENMAIVAFDLSYLPEAGNPMGVFFRIYSSYNRAVQADVLLSYEEQGQVVKVCPVNVKPGLNDIEIYKVANAEVGKWILSIDHSDALELDNIAYGVFPEKVPIRVSISDQRGSYFIKQCIEAFAGYENSLVLVDENPDILISYGKVNSLIKAKNHIVFAPEGVSKYWENLGEVSDYKLTNVLYKKHEMLKYCDWESIPFRGQKKMSLPEHSFILLEDESKNPLMYTYQAKDEKACVINLDPIESEFFLSPYFPILIYSIAQVQLKRDDEHEVYYSPGAIVNLPKGNQSFEIGYPDGKHDKIFSDSIGPLAQLGFYKIRYADHVKYIACSILGETESKGNNLGLKEDLLPIEKGLPPASYLVIFSILILITESVLYHKRKVG